MKKKIIAALLVTALVCTTLFGCSSKEKSEDTSSDAVTEDKTTEPTKVVLNEVAHSIFYAPMYVAIEEGYFGEEGIDLELVTGFGALTLI